MTQHDKQHLCDYLTGTVMPLAPALIRLGIDERLTIAEAEIADTIATCRSCSKWTDVDVMEDRRCPRCDAVLNPDNKPDGTD